VVVRGGNTRHGSTPPPPLLLLLLLLPHDARQITQMLSDNNKLVGGSAALQDLLGNI